MTSGSQHEEVYVALLDEGVDVWRPVVAERIAEGIYRIVGQPYRRDVERWEFEPGAVVFCEPTITSEGRVLAAKRRIS